VYEHLHEPPSLQAEGGGEEIRYQCGDHVAVLPQNDPELVQALAKRLNVKVGCWFTFEKENRTVLPFETPCTVRKALSQELDLTVKGAQLGELYKALYAHATEKVPQHALPE